MRRSDRTSGIWRPGRTAATAASLPEYRQLVEKRGIESLATTQEEAVELLRRDYEHNRGVVNELGLRME